MRPGAGGTWAPGGTAQSGGRPDPVNAVSAPGLCTAPWLPDLVSGRRGRTQLFQQKSQLVTRAQKRPRLGTRTGVASLQEHPDQAGKESTHRFRGAKEREPLDPFTPHLHYKPSQPSRSACPLPATQGRDRRPVRGSRIEPQPRRRHGSRRAKPVGPLTWHPRGHPGSSRRF